MHYYKHHIGDYDQATRHLSFVEDAAYSRMIRKYYAEERPLPADVEQVCKLIGARRKEEKVAVGVLLNEFFTLTDDGWRNSRCDKEIKASQTKAERNRTVGKLGGRPKKTQTVSEEEPITNPNGFCDETQKVSGNNPSHYPLPITTTTEAKASAADAAPDSKSMIWKLGVGLLMAAGSSEAHARSFLGKHAKTDESKLAEVIGHLAANPKIEPKGYIAKAMEPEKQELAF